MLPLLLKWKHPEIRNRYLNLKKRSGHMRLLLLPYATYHIYHILKNGEPYNAELYKKAELLPISREITIEQAIFIAQRQGFHVTAAT